MANLEDSTIERWKTEPRLLGLEPGDVSVEHTTPLWKDLALASIVSILLWGAVLLAFN
jgi:hypothetical protein